MHPAHPTKIKAGGATYLVRRDFDLIARLEAHFGPLAAIEKALRARTLTADHLARMMHLVLAADADPPSLAEIKAHVADDGVGEVSDGLAVLVMHLMLGHKRACAWLDAEAERAAAEGAAQEDPTVPAISIGTD